MGSQVTLPFWPTTLDCLSWSKNNLIAVAGGEQVAILIPRLHEPGPDGTNWNSITFKANAFTADEVPLSDPLSFANLSVGEELSLRHVQALGWSSPGLGRYGRCVLAVLSSNHILSFWECDGKVNDGANWKRTVVVNHALRRYYNNADQSDGETEQKERERLRVTQRVRAFAWSQTVHGGLVTSEESIPHAHCGYQLLAVSTEAGDIILLRVVSPHSILSNEHSEWKVEVTHCFNVGDLASEALRSGLFVEQHDDRPLHNATLIADHLALGPWRQNNSGGCYISTIALIANRRLFSVEVEGRRDQSSLGAEFKLTSQQPKHLNRSRSDMTGPLSFGPKTGSVTAFAADGVYCIDTFAGPDEATSPTSHHLDDRWDEVSGVAYTSTKSGSPQVQVVSHLSSARAETTALSVPFNTDEVSKRPPWQAALKRSKTSFSAQFDWSGQVQERTWGIAASPLGDFVATAATFLPLDAIAYIMPHDQRTVINITPATSGEGDFLPVEGGTAHPSEVSSETLLFSLRSHLERHPATDDPESLVDLMLKTINHAEDRSERSGDRPMSDDSRVLTRIRYIKQLLSTRPNLVKERLRLIADIALKRSPDTSRVSKQVIQFLVLEVLKLAVHFPHYGVLSSKVYRVYEKLRSKLQPGTKSNKDIEDWNEDCHICHKSIPFESVKWARCESGHQFSRCGLTFLAIEEPGITKYCNICSMQYFNEWSLSGFWGPAKDENIEMTELSMEDVETSTISDQVGPRVESAPDEQPTEQPHSDWVHVSHGPVASSESPGSLARILFAVFDACIYCGGNFTVR
ncbi:hypothetical protein LTR37_001160 [Vermiconidia calcicola]|uniref:Uncharacterized protein n=1 Tax=Vermiconidia calcicola TaxID=1690605 RepID=A0ACC3NX94_9PEZI|nr:hypothetical protein LTR37_001160 [Vermiconidia calcicola]